MVFFRDNPQLIVNGIFISLSHTEHQVLLHLFDQRGQVVRRESFLDEIWGMDRSVDVRIVDIYVSKVRDKINIDPTDPLIRTIRSGGYMFGPYDKSKATNVFEIQGGRIKFYLDDSLVVIDGKDISLTPQESKILEILSTHTGAVVEREQFNTYEADGLTPSRSIEAHISGLRTKLGDTVIETVRGKGYRLKV